MVNVGEDLTTTTSEVFHVPANLTNATIDNFMLVNESYGVVKYANNSFQLFYYNATNEDPTHRMTLKYSSLKNVTNLRHYQFDKQRGYIYIGDTVSMNVTKYNITPVYDD